MRVQTWKCILFKDSPHWGRHWKDRYYKIPQQTWQRFLELRQGGKKWWNQENNPNTVMSWENSLTPFSWDEFVMPPMEALQHFKWLHLQENDKKGECNVSIISGYQNCLKSTKKMKNTCDLGREHPKHKATAFVMTETGLHLYTFWALLSNTHVVT